MAAASAHEAILDAAAAVLAGLALVDQNGEALQIYRRTSLADVALGANIAFPCLAYGPDGMLSSQGSDTADEVWGYPLAVRLLARLPLSEPAFTPMLLAWRQKVRDAFQRKPLAVTFAGLKEAYQALLQPSPVSEPEAAPYQLLSSRLSFQVGAVETRP